MEPNQSQQNSGFKMVYAFIVAIIAVVGGLIFWNSKQNSGTPITDTTTGTPQSTTTPITDGKKKYFDGTYTAEGSYATPESGEKVLITLVLKDGVVTDVTFTSEAKDRTSKEMQQAFSEGFKTYVVGKSIDSINLTVVNGSSLTPKGFMDALEKIKVQAQTRA